MAKKYGHGLAEVYSAGSKPSGTVNPSAVDVMQEANIDISQNKSKGFFDLPIKEFDYVVTLGCNDTCPFYPAKEKINWEIEDPKEKPLEEFRAARDQIEDKVLKLLKTI